MRRLAVRTGEKEAIMFFVVLALFVVFGGLLTVITVQNLDTSVLLAVFTWQTPTLPLGLVVLFSFVLGALLLYVVSWIAAWRDGRQMKKLRLRVAQLEQAAMGGMAAASLPGSGIAAVPMPGIPETDTMQQPQQPQQPQG
jgi:uncharacterized integral membrane protein